jgi:hypothetical protein
MTGDVGSSGRMFLLLVSDCDETCGFLSFSFGKALKSNPAFRWD